MYTPLPAELRPQRVEAAPDCHQWERRRTRVRPAPVLPRCRVLHREDRKSFLSAPLPELKPTPLRSRSITRDSSRWPQSRSIWLLDRRWERRRKPSMLPAQRSEFLPASPPASREPRQCSAARWPMSLTSFWQPSSPFTSCSEFYTRVTFTL